MDILHKLRVIFWFLVAGLWGLFLYQYISEDLNSLPKIKLSQNPFYSSKTKTAVERKYIPPKPQETETRAKEIQETFSQKISSQTARILIDAKDIKDIPDMHLKNIQEEQVSPKSYYNKSDTPQPIEGFAFVQTDHFFIYQEGDTVDENIVKDLENLHGNIILDLIAFSPWQRENKVHIYFSKNPATYQKLTGRPAWSGGAANMAEKKIYLYESEEAFGILAHELTHIYFDSFFENSPSPLWLSEGMAVYIQVERAGSYPRWLKENLELLKNGGGYKVSDIVKIETLEGADDKSVKLWYAQSYSLVLFLMRAKRGDAFYQFCKYIKQGENVSLALYKAYGSPYNKLSSLEVVWRYDLKTGKLSQLNQ
ncbi:MAG: hypothetical protein GX447_01720 [Elusimicrobia bacterium]|nr:hypothetical protein [Elusimicrobiota bacterium]